MGPFSFHSIGPCDSHTICKTSAEHIFHEPGLVRLINANCDDICFHYSLAAVNSSLSVSVLETRWNISAFVFRFWCLRSCVLEFSFTPVFLLWFHIFTSLQKSQKFSSMSFSKIKLLFFFFLLQIPYSLLSNKQIHDGNLYHIFAQKEVCIHSWMRSYRKCNVIIAELATLHY